MYEFGSEGTKMRMNNTHVGSRLNVVRITLACSLHSLRRHLDAARRMHDNGFVYYFVAHGEHGGRRVGATPARASISVPPLCGSGGGELARLP